MLSPSRCGCRCYQIPYKHQVLAHLCKSQARQIFCGSGVREQSLGRSIPICTMGSQPLLNLASISDLFKVHQSDTELSILETLCSILGELCSRIETCASMDQRPAGLTRWNCRSGHLYAVVSCGRTPYAACGRFSPCSPNRLLRSL